MSETSPMFLTLTPAMNGKDGGKAEPASVDHVTLNLAVESLSYHFVSGDKLGPLASSVQVASVGSESPVSQSDSTPTEQNKVEPPHITDEHTDTVPEPTEQNKVEPPRIDDKPTDIVIEPVAKDHIDVSVLPTTQNDKQDTVALKQDKVVDKLSTAAPTLPTQFFTPATALKHRLENTKDLIVCPGVYDGFSARIALSVGFDALYMVSNL